VHGVPEPGVNDLMLPVPIAGGEVLHSSYFHGLPSQISQVMESAKSTHRSENTAASSVRQSAVIPSSCSISTLPRQEWQANRFSAPMCYRRTWNQGHPCLHSLDCCSLFQIAHASNER
jgi:hypothetical protein